MCLCVHTYTNSTYLLTILFFTVCSLKMLRCTQTCIYVCVCIYIYTRALMCLCAILPAVAVHFSYIHTHTHIYIYIYLFVCIHIHTCITGPVLAYKNLLTRVPYSVVGRSVWASGSIYLPLVIREWRNGVTFFHSLLTKGRFIQASWGFRNETPSQNNTYKHPCNPKP